MENLFQPLHVIALSAIYALIMVGVTYFVRGYGRNKVSFLLAGRDVGCVESGISIAATWIWAPALFVGAQKAYTEGWIGVFWFIVPNVLSLALFSWFAGAVREKLPNGFTFSEFVRDRFSSRCHSVYLFQFSALAVSSYSLQLVAGAGVIKMLTGMSMFWSSMLLSIIALSYTALSGLKMSVVSDILKMALIFFIGMPIVFLAVSHAGGVNVVLDGINGVSGNFTSLFSSSGLRVFLEFGLPTTIGLLNGPFGDQSFWQRAFSAKKETVIKSFLLGALFFALVPLVISLLGFIAAGTKLSIPSVQNTNVYAIYTYVGPVGVFLFLAIIIAGLVGTIESRLASIASLAGHDVIQRWGSKKETDSGSIRAGRLSMLFLTIISIGVASIPGIEILHLFLLNGQIRAATFLPTVMSILGVRLKEGGVFWGIIVSFLVGLPVFAWGNFNKDWHFIVGGSLFTLFASASVALLYSYRKAKKEQALA
ncbi:MAG: hypothetical protein PHX43_00465 [Alphaproteobacteria bacterium]|nr:hypothetical protein [Alphaproteobacteria bacterium]